jgi:hypothetical protein
MRAEKMTTPCRSWWRNCALHADSEIIAIDGMEDQIAPLGANVSKIRELISSLELCHHKADRWVYNIIEAIGAGETTKGLGTRSLGRQHPSEIVWQNACTALSSWCAGCSSTKVDLPIDNIPASRLFACLGKRSPLKEWQVQRVIEKIRSFIQWPLSRDDPTAQYVWLLLSPGDYEFVYLNQCPDHYKEREDFWRITVRTIIHDTENGDDANLSLAIAIDMLWPCHWRFVENLRIVLDAIGGKLNSEKPFAACGRNIILLPNRHQMENICNTLRAFYGDLEPNREVDREILMLLGKPTDVKKWLAASLNKTIRLQMHPPTDLRAVSALTGPDWIEENLL